MAAARRVTEDELAAALGANTARVFAYGDGSARDTA
jgi:hypothetical protein